MSKKNHPEDREAHEAARFAGLGAAAAINFGSGMAPAEILEQARIYEEFIVSGQCPPRSPPADTK